MFLTYHFISRAHYYLTKELIVHVGKQPPACALSVFSRVGFEAVFHA